MKKPLLPGHKYLAHSCTVNKWQSFDHLRSVALTPTHLTITPQSIEVLQPVNISSVQFSSVAQSCSNLCDPLDSSTPGLPVQHQLLEFIQTHVHGDGDAIQQFYPPSSPSPLAFNLSQHQGLFMSQFFASGGQSIGLSASTSVLPMNIQDWFPLGLTGWISLQSQGLSRVFSNTTVQKHQLFGTRLSL